MGMLFLLQNCLLKKENDALVWLFFQADKERPGHSWSMCLSPVGIHHREASTDFYKLKACLKSHSSFLKYSWRVVKPLQVILAAFSTFLKAISIFLNSKKVA